MDRLRKFFIISAVLLCVLLGIVFFYSQDRQFRSPKENENSGIPEDTAVIVPDDPEKLLPANLQIGKMAPDVIFQTSGGETVSSRSFFESGKNGAWFSFADSRNTGQSEIQAMADQMKAIASEFDIIPVPVGNSAAEGSDFLTDPGSAAYKSWGLQTLPSDIILDRQGYVLEYHTGKMEPAEMKGLLRRAAEGRDSVSLQFITNKMSDGRGGFYTSTKAKGSSPTGMDILSESQGLMMIAAAETKNRELFDQVWSFTKNHLMKNGLAAWYISEKGERAKVNALLDDLRIWYALDLAEKNGMGSYAGEAGEILSAVKKLCVDKKGRPVDFVDLSNGGQAETISLQYLDLVTLDLMAQADPDLKGVCQKAENILLDGRISDRFPLYYRCYNYKTRSYASDYLNTAEALYTLWNLSRANLLPDDSFQWMRERVMNGTLAARYKTNGSVVPGYDYHSTAVYALAALIARETGDEELFETALRRMERKFVLNAEDEYYGAYSQKGSAVYSFDQLLPFLVNISPAGSDEDGKE